MKIALDAGHGGRDPGAVGPTGLRESEAAFLICRYACTGLVDSVIEVFLMRHSDEFVSLVGRVERALKNQVDLFLSVHCNAFSALTAHGFEVWTSRGQTNADPIAENIFESIADAFPRLSPRSDKTDGDSDKEAGFAVLVGVEEEGIPGVLIETAFISNPTEETWLRRAGWRLRMAGAIVDGVNRRS
jgi:N-acetylmuramoyl-L-alanine amidase